MFFRLIAIISAAAVFATTTAVTAAATALFTRLGNVYGQGPTIKVSAVQSRNRLLCFLCGAHGYESKAASATGHAIHHEAGFDYSAVRGKCVLKVIFGGVEGKVSDKQFIITHSYDVLQIKPCSKLFPTTGFRIITELSSPEDLPDLETDKLSNERRHYRTSLVDSNGYAQSFGGAQIQRGDA
jgi:hypothetical protein